MDALYGPGETVTPAPLLWLALVHNIWVVILGTLSEFSTHYLLHWKWQH